MENLLAIILITLVAVVCSIIAVGNLVYRRRRRGKSPAPLKNLESLKQQGIITDEEFESMKDGTQRPEAISIESCVISAEEMREAIDATLKPASELERDESYTGDAKWARVFGINSDLNLTLKEITLLSMKIGRPREAIDLIAEVLAMNVPINSLEAAQSRGKAAFPNYKAIARMVWVKTRQRLSEPISIQKRIHEQRKLSDQSLLTELVPMVMKVLNIPIEASGFAAMLALIVAKMEFNAFSHEDEEDSR